MLCPSSEFLDRGKKDALKVVTYFKDKGIEVALPSPYRRAIDTIKPFLETNNMDVELVEDFRERKVDSYRVTWNCT